MSERPHPGSRARAGRAFGGGAWGVPPGPPHTTRPEGPTAARQRFTPSIPRKAAVSASGQVPPSTSPGIDHADDVFPWVAPRPGFFLHASASTKASTARSASLVEAPGFGTTQKRKGSPGRVASAWRRTAPPARSRGTRSRKSAARSARPRAESGPARSGSRTRRPRADAEATSSGSCSPRRACAPSR